MMKFVLISALLCGCIHSYAQDMVVLRDGTKLEVKVVESNESDIVYIFPNEEVRNKKAKKLIEYIQYASGRKEICQSLTMPIIESWEDWGKVIVTTNRDDVEGLQLIESVSVSAGAGGALDKAEAAHSSAVKKLKKKVAGMLCGIVLITSESFGGKYNNISSITGEGYKLESIRSIDQERTIVVPIINNEKDWEKVIVTTNRDDVEGLQLIESISVSAGNGGIFNSAENAHVKCKEKLKKKVAKMKCGIVLITSDSLWGPYDNMSIIKAEVYK